VRLTINDEVCLPHCYIDSTVSPYCNHSAGVLDDQEQALDTSSL